MNMDVVYKIGPIAGGVLVAVLGGWWLLTKRKQWNKQKRIAAFPRDTVIIHYYGRGLYAPAVSPFTIKLQTYLRITGIPYQNVETQEQGPKGKMPYIYYNGEVMGDSQFILEFLNKKYEKDIDKNLTPEQKAIARAFQKMVEENMYWCLAMNRWVFLINKIGDFFPDIPRVVHSFIKKFIYKSAYAQGMGRHTEQEVNHILRADLQALSDYLGSKRFLMGDYPCEADCAIFGMLTQLKWMFPDCEGRRLLLGTFKNLDAYCERMKSTYWPNWDDCTKQGQKSNTDT